jgi:hypothetical protein
MGLDIGGYDQKRDWPKLGPSLLIASCLILAVTTAKWPAMSSGGTASDNELEVEHANHLAGRVLSHLIIHHQSMFPQRQEPRFVLNDEDAPK